MCYKNFTLDDLFELSYLTYNFRIAVFLPASYALSRSLFFPSSSPPPPLVFRFPCLLICTVTWLEHTLWKLTVQRTSIVCDNLSSLNVVLHLVCGLRYAIDHTQETTQSQGSVLNSCHDARLCLIYSRIDRASVCRGFFTFVEIQNKRPMRLQSIQS